MNRRPLLILLSLITLSLPAQAAETRLGRVFFTPEQRAALDRQRQYTQTRETESHGGEITVNGVVRRSSGQGTAWINGIPNDDQSNAENRNLRVGDSVNQASGERSDLLRGGQIRIKPSNAKSR